MNFQHFNHFYRESNYDEIKVIGKEVEKEGKPYHIIGMTLKEKKVHLYVLEFAESCCEKEPWEKTPRESRKESMEEDRNNSYFMHVREFRDGENIYETAGATSGMIEHGGFGEAYMLFTKMYEAGWKITEESEFWEIPWENIAMTNIELQEEYDTLPQWSEITEVMILPGPVEIPVEKPVCLECGKNMEIEFPLKNGKKVVCYINKVELIDIWEEEEKKFSDNTYREKMLQHISEEEFEQMKKQFWEVLEEHCPRGKCYLGIEYECSEDISLNFYDKEYLDTLPKQGEGSASALWMRVKPEQELGKHGFKARGSVIQKPLEKTTKQLEAELFSYSEIVKKRVEKM